MSQSKASAPASPALPSTRYLLVLDFEATCKEDDRAFPNEIIEWPTVVVDTHAAIAWMSAAQAREGRTPQPTDVDALYEACVADTFRTFVKPTENPTLTAFCTQLTGITQEQVDAGLPSVRDAISSFEQWLVSHNFATPTTSANGTRVVPLSDTATFVTCGDWDLATCLRRECQRKKIPLPQWATRWVNIKNAFKAVMPHTERRSPGLGLMVGRCGLQFAGRAHSGIDDCRNIARVALCLMMRGHRF